VDGQIEKKEMEVGKGAAKGSSGGPNKDLPLVSNTRTLCEKMEDVLRGGSTFEASWGGGKAKAMKTGLEGKDVVDGRKASINQEGGRPAVARPLQMCLQWRSGNLNSTVGEGKVSVSSL
jgi:hypothetical protein